MLLEDETRDEVLRLQYYIPFIKLLAVEGAKQSPLHPIPNEGQKIYRDGVKIFKVFFFDDMIKDRSLQLNAQTEYSILQLSTQRQIQHLAKLKGVYLGINHLAYELEEYAMTFRSYLDEHRDIKQLHKIFDGIIRGVEALH
jgi:hypothetical protein